MRRTLIVSLFFMFSWHYALASPQDDAEYIADVILTPELIETARSAFGKQIVRNYEQPLSELNLSINDPDRFAAMLPNDLFEQDLQACRERIVAWYLKEFTPEQLVGIAEFKRTSVWKKLMGASSGQYNGTVEALSDAVQFPYVGLDRTVLANFLSDVEIEAYKNFFETDAGQAFHAQRYNMGLSVAFSFAQQSTQLASNTPNLNTHYMIEILETDDIVRAPNRIWRQDVIKKIHAELP